MPESASQIADQSPRATSEKVALISFTNPASNADTSTAGTSQEDHGTAKPANFRSDVHELQSPSTPANLPSVPEKLPENHTIGPEVVSNEQDNEPLQEIPSDLPPRGLPNETTTKSDISTSGATSTVEASSTTQSAFGSTETATDPPTYTHEPEQDLSLDGLTRSRTNEDVESTVSGDSFHTLDDEHTSIHRTSMGKKPYQHRREISEMTVTADSVKGHDQATLSQTDDAIEPMPDLERPDLTEQDPSWPVMRTPGAFTDELEIRRRLQHRRSLSPLPPASILQSSNQIERGSPIPAALLQRAASLAVVKPLEVFVFVVQVLARIAGGATMNDLVSGNLFRNPNVRRTASGTFDQDVRGRSSAIESEEEDDYGVPVHGRRKSSNKEERSGLPLSQDIDDAASYASID